MPTAGSKVSYKFGTQDQYDALSIKDENTLYFTVDTCKLFVGSQEYTRSTMSGPNPPQETIVSYPQCIYIQLEPHHQTIWYNPTGDVEDWIELVDLGIKQIDDETSQGWGDEIPTTYPGYVGQVVSYDGTLWYLYNISQDPQTGHDVYNWGKILDEYDTSELIEDAIKGKMDYAPVSTGIPINTTQLPKGQLYVNYGSGLYSNDYIVGVKLKVKGQNGVVELYPKSYLDDNFSPTIEGTMLPMEYSTYDNVYGLGTFWFSKTHNKAYQLTSIAQETIDGQSIYHYKWKVLSNQLVTSIHTPPEHQSVFETSYEGAVTGYAAPAYELGDFHRHLDTVNDIDTTYQCISVIFGEFQEDGDTYTGYTYDWKTVTTEEFVEDKINDLNLDFDSKMNLADWGSPGLDDPEGQLSWTPNSFIIKTSQAGVTPITKVEAYTKSAADSTFDKLPIIKSVLAVDGTDRPPTYCDADNYYPIGTVWIDQPYNRIYQLDKIVLESVESTDYYHYYWRVINDDMNVSSSPPPDDDYVEIVDYGSGNLAAPAPYHYVGNLYHHKSSTADMIYVCTAIRWSPTDEYYYYTWKALADKDYVDTIVGDIETLLSQV